MITALGLAELEHVLADNPNMFPALARETLLALLELGRDPAGRLYAAIAHGTDAHRAWLRAALEAFFDGRPIPVEDASPLTADQAARLLEDVPAGRGVRLEAPGFGADRPDTVLLPPGEIARLEAGLRGDPVESRRAELEAARAVVAERNPDLDVVIEGDRLVARARKISRCACVSPGPVEPRPGEDPRVFEARRLNPGCTVELMGDRVVRTCSAFRTRGPE